MRAAQIGIRYFPSSPPRARFVSSTTAARGISGSGYNRRMIRLSALALVALCASAHATKIEVGPMLQDVRPDGVSVVWEGDTPSAAALIVESEQGDRRLNTPVGTHHEIRAAD